MQFCVLFSIFALLLSSLSASPTVELSIGEAGTAANVASSSQAGETSYECGNFFFSEREAQEALKLSLARLNSDSQAAQQYFGPLYSDAKTTEYLLWPIKRGQNFKKTNKYNVAINYIVFKRDGKEVIDIISKISNSKYTKCIKKLGSQTLPSTSTSEEPNGYQCGHEFFSDNTIRSALGLARQRMGEGRRYPAPYIGSLYPEDSQYMIWPIMSRKNLYRSGSGKAEVPYFLILDKAGDLKDIVVKGFSDNYLRCTRSRKAPVVSAFDPLNKLFVPPPKTGYLCGKYFFGIKALRDAANEARSTIFYKRSKIFPKKYDGPPFYKPYLLWPILIDGRLYNKGAVGSYRVVLSPEFEVKSAVIVQGDKIEVCDTKTIAGKKNHDTSSYQCIGQVFSSDQLIIAAEVGCKWLEDGKKTFYPAIYKGPRFDKDGPYFTYPAFPYGLFTRKPGLYRVVMNPDCEVVGALTLTEHVDITQRKLIKCYRADDGPMPENYFDEQNDYISEFRPRY